MRRYLKDRDIEFDIRRDQIYLSDTLGSGEFGSVCRAVYRIDDEPPVTVAVKTLKTSRHAFKQVIADCSTFSVSKLVHFLIDRLHIVHAALWSDCPNRNVFSECLNVVSASEMTCIVSSGALNSTHSLTRLNVGQVRCLRSRDKVSVNICGGFCHINFIFCSISSQRSGCGYTIFISPGLI